LSWTATCASLVHKLSLGCLEPAPGHHGGASIRDYRSQARLRCKSRGALSSESSSKNAEHVADAGGGGRPRGLYRIVGKIDAGLVGRRANCGLPRKAPG